MATLTGALPRPTTYRGVWSWITTVDHKRIGILYGASAFVFFLIAGIEALIMRLQLAQAEANVVSPDVFNQLFTMHGTTMVFMVAMPMSAAFFNYIIPLMIGARDVAFPRLNAFSYWAFIFGALLMHSSFLFGGAPDVGWFAYANLTGKPFSPGHRVDFWVLGLQVLGISSMASAFNFFVTIINMRAPGMSLIRMPVFVWNTLVVATLIMLAFPVLTVGITFLMFDRFFGTLFYVPSQGGNPILWQHLFWVFGHPEVYILILPAFGIVSEIFPTFSRKPLFGYAFVVAATVAIAVLGFSVWAHHMFTVGLGPIANAAFSASTMIIAVPTGVKIFNWLGTMWGGSLNLKTPMLFSIGMVALFIIGGLSGVMHAAPPVDTQHQDSYFVVAHFHYVLFGGTIFGLFAGIYYWWPKVTGRFLHEGLGKLNFWLLFIGMNLTFGPMHVLGIYGMPRRIYTYQEGMGWDLINLIITIGGFIVALAVLVFIYNVYRSLRKGEVAGPDPWDGRTLEWKTSSPPPPYNFAVIPTVHSRDPLWAEKYGELHEGMEAVSEAKPPHQGNPSHGQHGSGEVHGIHMPSPSYSPVVVAFGLALGAGGLIVGKALLAFGLLIAVVGIYAWALEPVAKEEKHAQQH